MTHGSLFSGIGGFDLAAEWMGWENVFHCEWNEFGQKVLKYYWPNAISYGDITKTDFTIHRGRIDILTGGFPCQPYSMAGKRLGKEDERHLWPSMLRAIREIQPTWVVGENVSGLVNWNGGMVFNEVQADLEAEGYEVIPFLLPAAGVNAPHKRERVWFVAHNTMRIRPSEINGRKEYKQNDRKRLWIKSGTNGNLRNVADTYSNIRRERGMYQIGQKETERYFGTCNARNYQWRTWQNFPTQPPVCSRNDGISTRLSGITLSKHRKESIKAYGNAIVPQVVFQIFKAIDQFNNSL
jgi:DNA (cytosine-5)-methyltransferase 1